MAKTTPPTIEQWGRIFVGPPIMTSNGRCRRQRAMDNCREPAAACA